MAYAKWHSFSGATQGDLLTLVKPHCFASPHTDYPKSLSPPSPISFPYKNTSFLSKLLWDEKILATYNILINIYSCFLCAVKIEAPRRLVF